MKWWHPVLILIAIIAGICFGYWEVTNQLFFQLDYYAKIAEILTSLSVLAAFLTYVQEREKTNRAAVADQVFFFRKEVLVAERELSALILRSIQNINT